jgi:hypothetical protein
MKLTRRSNVAAPAPAPAATKPAPSGLLEHLKARGHAWVIALSAITILGYIAFAINSKQDEAKLIANSTVALVSMISGYGGILALIMLAMLSKDQLGELGDFKFYLVIGILFGVLVALIKMLALFKLL